MPDREKVIRGLECRCRALPEIACQQCDYGMTMGRRWGCDFARMCRDALVLLKAQEPRVMTLEDVRALQDGAVVWLEDNDKADVIPAIVNHIWNSLPNVASFTVAYIREVKADMLWYGAKWRCWTSRPTEAEMEATPWN